MERPLNIFKKNTTDTHKPCDKLCSLCLFRGSHLSLERDTKHNHTLKNTNPQYTHAHTHMLINNTRIT